MFAIRYRTTFYLISAALLLISLLAVFFIGLKPSIDFTGGSMLEVSFAENDGVTRAQIERVLADDGFVGSQVRSTDGNGYFIKLPRINDEGKEMILEQLTFGGTASPEEQQFTTVGPTLGKELTTKASVALLLVILAIICYVAYVFRSVTKPVSSWKYGFVAIIALIHDIIITLGFFALAGFFWGTEIDTLFVTALLVILGYSVNDSIVVLDRVREKLSALKEKQRKIEFVKTVESGLRETIARSINTSITTLLALVALYIFGGDATREFALALIVGVIAGSYSSIFLAAPLLVTFFKNQKEKPEKETPEEN